MKTVMNLMEKELEKSNHLHAKTIQALTGFLFSNRTVVFCRGSIVKPEAVKVS